MRDSYLEVTFRNGKALAAYLYLPRGTGARSARTEKMGRGILVDYGEGGEAIGLEITAPAHVSLDELNEVLHRLGHVGLAPRGISAACRGLNAPSTHREASFRCENRR